MEWISVEDRLPEREREVLVLEDDGDMSVRYIPRYRGGEYAGDCGRSWYPGGLSVDFTTHWIPLPTPPKED